MLKNSGLRRACLYSLPPHLLGYCGPQDKKKSSLLLDFVNGKKKDENKVRDILDKEFIVSGYYRMLAKVYKLDLFDEKIVEAHWIGNKLLDKFFKAGKITPYHLYHVLAIGSVTGRIKFDDLKRNQCRISWGKIIKQKPTTVEYQPLERKNKDFVLGRPVVKKVNWNKDFVPELKIGNLVSLHWDTIVEVLTEKETKMLQDYTRLTLITLCMI